MPSNQKVQRDRQALESWKKDIKVVEGILESMGVDYDPAVVPQLLACAYEQTTSVLQRAQKLAIHAGRTAVEVRPKDISLAVRSGPTGASYRSARSGIFTTKQLVAKSINSKPIPRVSSTFGVYLPKKAAPVVVPLLDNYVVTVDKPATNDSKGTKEQKSGSTVEPSPPVASTKTEEQPAPPNPKKRKSPDDEEEVNAAFEKRPRLS